NLYQKSTAGAANTEVLLLEDSQRKTPLDWSSDGRFILYQTSDTTGKTPYGLWALPVAQGNAGTIDRKPFPVATTTFNETDGQFSPDGKWVAYQSDGTGQFEIYVQPFPGPGASLPVSKNGGAQVRWRRDGKELFYIAPDDRLMAVAIRFAPDGR